jgi:type IV secretory pathway TrbF-like protein
MEDKVLELEKRLEKLEKIEKRRKSIMWLKIAGITLLVIAVLVFGFIVYQKVQETIRPYKEFIDKTNEVDNQIDTQIDKIKNFFNGSENTEKNE